VIKHFVGLCSVQHTDVTGESAKLSSSLKSVAADQQDATITYTYSVTFVVSQSSSSRMRVINHNWSAMKQRLHPQSV